MPRLPAVSPHDKLIRDAQIARQRAEAANQEAADLEAVAYRQLSPTNDASTLPAANPRGTKRAAVGNSAASSSSTCLLLVLVTVLLQAQHRSDYLQLTAHSSHHPLNRASRGHLNLFRHIFSRRPSRLLQHKFRCPRDARIRNNVLAAEA